MEICKNVWSTAATFDFIINYVKPKHGRIKYFKGNEMKTIKRYQFSTSMTVCQKKPVTKWQLGLDDKALLVFIRICLDSTIEDSAFWFIISAR